LAVAPIEAENEIVLAAAEPCRAERVFIIHQNDAPKTSLTPNRNGSFWRGKLIAFVVLYRKRPGQMEEESSHAGQLSRTDLEVSSLSDRIPRL
jgi:hypothetical protein